MWTKPCPWCNAAVSAFTLRRILRKSGRTLTCRRCNNPVAYKNKNYWPLILFLPLAVAAIGSKLRLFDATGMWVTLILAAVALLGIHRWVSEATLVRDDEI